MSYAIFDIEFQRILHLELLETYGKNWRNSGDPRVSQITYEFDDNNTDPNAIYPDFMAYNSKENKLKWEKDYKENKNGIKDKIEKLANGMDDDPPIGIWLIESLRKENKKFDEFCKNRRCLNGK